MVEGGCWDEPMYSDSGVGSHPIEDTADPLGVSGEISPSAKQREALRQFTAPLMLQLNSPARSRRTDSPSVALKQNIRKLLLIL